MKSTVWMAGRIVLAILAFAFVARNLITVGYYGAASLDRTGTMTELPEWTNAHAVSQINQLHKLLLEDPGKTLISDASDGVSANLEAANFTGTPFLLFNSTMAYGLGEDLGNLGDVWSIPLGKAAFRASMSTVIAAHNQMYSPRVVLRDESAPGKPVFDRFFLDPRIQQAVLKPSNTLLLRSFNWTLFNNRTHPGQIDPTFSIRPYSSVHDFLVFVTSYRGFNPPSPSMAWRFEDDYFDPAKSWEGMGRYLLFHVVNPAEQFRVVLDVTTTTMGDGRNSIPPASVLGTKREWFPYTGYYGAARLVSPPTSAQMVNGLPFIELDMGRDGAPFVDKRHGVMTLYGKKFPLDYRKIVAFNRDVSIISDAAYRSQQAPQDLGVLPKGLENPNLEFSGLYEDGWMADRAVVQLSAPKGRKTTLRLKALVPYQSLGQSVRVTLSVDGKIVASGKPLESDLLMNVAMAGDGRRHVIRIVAGPVFHLPGGDGRPATIRIDHLGFD